MFKKLKSFFQDPKTKAKQFLLTTLSSPGVYDLHSILDSSGISSSELVALVSDLKSSNALNGVWLNKRKLRFLAYSESTLNQLLSSLKTRPLPLSEVCGSLQLQSSLDACKSLLKHKHLLLSSSLVYHPSWLKTTIEHALKTLINDFSVPSFDPPSSKDEFPSLFFSSLPSFDLLEEYTDVPISILQTYFSSINPENELDLLVFPTARKFLPRSLLSSVLSSFLLAVTSVSPSLDLSALSQALELPFDLLEQTLLSLLNSQALPDFQYLATEGILQKRG